MISIIIPVLNEAKNILILLEHLTNKSTSNHISEIIIVDGGSVDGTLTKVKEFKSSTSVPINVFLSEKGRAKQMNNGATKAGGVVLYFLHADSFPPSGFDRSIFEAVQKGKLAGCFRMKFDNPHWWLGLAGWFTQFNWKACRGGDQSLFITKKLFNVLGGYDERYTIFEDNVLINALYKQNQFTVLPQRITTSARLYERVGIWKTQYHFYRLYLHKKMGATPQQLLAYYSKNLK